MINYVDIVIIILIAALLYGCIRSLLPSKRTGRPACSCGCDCSTCALNCMHQAVMKRNCNS